MRVDARDTYAGWGPRELDTKRGPFTMKPKPQNERAISVWTSASLPTTRDAHESVSSVSLILPVHYAITDICNVELRCV